ncbi:MAG: 5-oxoprolinase subunit PxpA [Chthoniobacterales bacterium]
MNLSLDLNADLGEGAPHDTELLGLVTSASIACGFHAGSATIMHASISAARDAGVAVGAHPGFEDRENFGRREIAISPKETFAIVVYQIGAFAAIASSIGIQPQHVKPHGALYNLAARDEAVADAIARAVAAVNPSLFLFAPGESALARAAENHGLRVVNEVFADRNYFGDGSLVPRARPDAILHDPEEAAQRVLRMLSDSKVRSVDGTDVTVRADTVCIHGDTPEAVEFARALRLRLAQTGVVLGPPTSS